MMTLRMPLSIATSVPFLNCIICQAWRLRACPRGSITISLAPRLAACLKKVAATGWFSVGFGPITMMTSEFLDSFKGAGPGAVIDVVAAEAGAHQLLEQVGLRVGAFRRAEPGERLRPVAVADLHQAARRALHRLFPGRPTAARPA